MSFEGEGFDRHGAVICWTESLVIFLTIMDRRTHVDRWVIQGNAGIGKWLFCMKLASHREAFSVDTRWCVGWCQAVDAHRIGQDALRAQFLVALWGSSWS